MNKANGKKETMQKEVGDWINIFPWQFFVTLTYSRENVSPFLSERYLNWYLNGYSKKVIYFYVVETHLFRRSPHIHILIGGTNTIRLWKHGNTKILPYDPQLGGNYYITKHIGSDDVWWDIKANPPLKDDGK